MDLLHERMAHGGYQHCKLAVHVYLSTCLFVYCLYWFRHRRSSQTSCHVNKPEGQRQINRMCEKSRLMGCISHWKIGFNWDKPFLKDTQMQCEVQWQIQGGAKEALFSVQILSFSCRFGKHVAK